MPRQTNCLMVDAFHQATVTCDNPGFVVNKIVAKHRVQVAFCDSHANRSRNSLPQRPRSCFNAFELEILGMPRAGTT